MGKISQAQSRSQGAHAMDLKGSIPTFIRITDGKVHDVNILDELILESGAIYIMDRG